MDARRARFERLVHPVLGDLYRFARRLTRDPVRAEDLLQQALLRGLDRLGQLESDDAFRGWQGRVLYTTWLNGHRRRRNETMAAMELNDEVHATGLSPEGDLAVRRLGERIAAALDTLPEAQREAVWLVDGQGFKYAEAATVLAISPGTVASRVARGREALRIVLAPDAVEAGVQS